MRKLSLLLAAACLVGSFSTSFAQTNGYIGVFADAAGTQCCIVSTGPAPITFYIIAVLGGATGGGLTTAEFRVELPNLGGMFLTPTGAGNISLGNPLDDASNPNDAGGCNIAFPTCQGAAPGDHVLLYTVNGFNPGATSLDLVVKPHLHPTNVLFNCPYLTKCDVDFTIVCLTPTKDALGGEDPILFRSYIRTSAGACPSTGPGTFSCGPVAVAPTTWSTMKGLYR